MNNAALRRPHFRNPPIFEQVISFAFDRIDDFEAVDFGQFYEQIKEEFPVSTMVERHNVTSEIFEGQDVRMSMELTPNISLPRVLFKRADGGETIQLQDDFFAFNWVKTPEGGVYPRFEMTSNRLWHLFAEFRQFVFSRHGIEIAPVQTEITNVNIIPVEDFGGDWKDIADVFVVDPFNWEVPGLIAETYVRQRMHRIVDTFGIPLGRLHSNISPVVGPTGERAFKFELTARSMRSAYSDAQLTEFLETGHNMINGAFMASIQPKMKTLWEAFDG